MNVVDSLVVTLGLNADDFKKGAQEANSAARKVADEAEKTGNRIEKSGKGAAEAINKIRDQTVELFALFAAGKGLKDFIADMDRTGTAAANMSANLGLMPQTLSKFSQAAQAAGGSADAMRQTMAGLVSAFAQFSLYGKLPDQMMTALLRMQSLSGMSIVPRQGESISDFLYTLADAAQKVAQSKGPAAARELLNEVGITDEATIARMERGSKAYRDYVESFSRYAPSRQFLNDAAELNETLSRLDATLTKTGQDAFTQFEPGLNGAATAVKNWIDANPQEAAQGLTAIAGAVAIFGAGGVLAGIAALARLNPLLSALAAIVGAHGLLQGGFDAGLDKLGVLPHDNTQDFSLWGDAKRVWNDFFGSGSSGGSGGITGLRKAVGVSPNARLSNAPAIQTGTAGQFRPVRSLSDADLSDDVVNTIAGEAKNNQGSIDAVVDNMFNRIGTSAYGPSGNLSQVARAPGQYAGYRKASPEEAAYIRSRIRAIASGAVPDITNGSNEYRAGSYRGAWYRNHADAPVIGGNRFARNPRVPAGTFAPYDGSSIPSLPIPTDMLGPGASVNSSTTNDNRQSSNTNSFTVGSLVVNTQATDADNISRTIVPAIKRNSFSMLANYGIA